MKILLKHINLFSLVRSTQLFGCNYWCFTSIHGKLLSTVSIVTRSISLSGIANLSLGNQFRTNKVRFIEFLVFCSSEIFLIYQHQSSLQINSFSSWVCSSLVNKLTFGPSYREGSRVPDIPLSVLGLIKRTDLNEPLSDDCTL